MVWARLPVRMVLTALSRSETARWCWAGAEVRVQGVESRQGHMFLGLRICCLSCSHVWGTFTSPGAMVPHHKAYSMQLGKNSMPGGEHSKTSAFLCCSLFWFFVFLSCIVVMTACHLCFLFGFGRERFQKRFFTEVSSEKNAVISQYWIFIHRKQKDSVTTSNKTF